MPTPRSRTPATSRGPTRTIDSIATWDCKTEHQPTPKDDLQNAYAAIFQVPQNAPNNAGHKVLYLGSERLQGEGDSFAGFWLLKDPTVGCSGATGTTGFTGRHTDGDILVRSDTTKGGTQANITVYEWQGDDATGKPVLLIDGAECDP